MNIEIGEIFDQAKCGKCGKRMLDIPEGGTIRPGNDSICHPCAKMMVRELFAKLGIDENGQPLQS